MNNKFYADKQPIVNCKCGIRTEVNKFGEIILCKACKESCRCIPSGKCHSWSLIGCPHPHIWINNKYTCQLYTYPYLRNVGKNPY